MPSSISINTYLWTHTWQRWRERPGGPLARGLVVCILAGLAAGVLSAYFLSEADLARRLAQQGINTLVLRLHEPAMRDGGRGMLQSRFRMLDGYGVVLPVTTLVSRVRADIDGQSAPMAWVGQKNWREAFVGTLPETAAWGVDRLAPGLRVRSASPPRGRQASSAHLAPPMQSLLGRTAFIYPDPYPRSPESIMETALVFTRVHGAPPIQDLADALRVVVNLDRLDKIDLRGPELLLEQLRELQGIHSALRMGLGALMGVTITVVFGSLAALEYSETRQVIGLLRSLGAATRHILLQKYMADALLANGCFAIALGIWGLLAPPLFVSLGFAADLAQKSAELRAAPDMLMLLGCLNMGVISGLVPVIRVVLLPIGRTLG